MNVDLMTWLNRQNAFFSSTTSAGRDRTVTHSFLRPKPGVCCLLNANDIERVRYSDQVNLDDFLDHNLRDVYKRWKDGGSKCREDMLRSMTETAFDVFFELYSMAVVDYLGPKQGYPVSVCETPSAKSFVMFADIDVRSEHDVNRVCHEEWVNKVISHLYIGSKDFLDRSGAGDFSMIVCQKVDPVVRRPILVSENMMGIHVVWDGVVSDVCFMREFRSHCIKSLVEGKVPIYPNGGEPTIEGWDKTWDPAPTKTNSKVTLRMVGSIAAGKKISRSSVYRPTVVLRARDPTGSNPEIIERRPDVTEIKDHPDCYGDWVNQTSIHNTVSSSNLTSYITKEEKEVDHLKEVIRQKAIKNNKAHIESFDLTGHDRKHLLKALSECTSIRNFDFNTLNRQVQRFVAGKFVQCVLKTSCRKCPMAQREHKSNTLYFMFDPKEDSCISLRCFSNSSGPFGISCKDNHGKVGRVSKRLTEILKHITDGSKSGGAFSHPV